MSNVGQLGVAYTVPVDGVGAYGALATNPIVEDGSVYFEDLGSNVYSVDANSGKVNWKKEGGQISIGPNGVAVDGDTVYYVTGMKGVAALDSKSGEQKWQKDLPVSEIEGIDIQPVVHDGVLLVSSIPGAGAESFYEGGARGIIYGLDPENGEVKWQWASVPEDLWGNAEVNSGGGAWYPPAVDEDSGTTYWGIGNPAPYPGTDEFPAGTSRPGDNLYTDSIVALNGDGTMEWYHQVKPHDLFDLDFQSSPILASISVDGNDKDVVIGAGKLGRVIAFDRENGDVLWDTKVGAHQNDALQELPAGETVVLPGTFGGVETPMAYSNNTVFVPILNVSTTYTPTELVEGSTDIEGGTGQLVAIDASTGEIKWTADQPSPNFGGATVVGDVVFTASFDGKIYGYDVDSGEQVWSTQAPAGINGWPAVSGDTIYWPAGLGKSPVLVALRLGATGPSASATPETTVTPQGGGVPVTPTAGQSGNAVTLTNETKSGLTFEKTELKAPAGTTVTVNYLNDTPIPHNIAFYQGSDSSARVIGKTEIGTGPGDQQTTSFTAPSQPGTYYFQCDVHPAQMNGKFIVQQ